MFSVFCLPLPFFFFFFFPFSSLSFSSKTCFWPLCTKQNDLKEKFTSKEGIRYSTLSHRVTKFGLQFHVRKPIQKHYYKATVALEKSIKDSRDFMTAEFRSNQTEIKNQLNEMQSKLEVLMTRVKR